VAPGINPDGRTNQRAGFLRAGGSKSSSGKTRNFEGNLAVFGGRHRERHED
jgi:hypothetical protein